MSSTANSSKSVRFVATFLLIFSCILFGLSKFYINLHPIFPWLLAFSEAAMVGALADWFAVSALFRHPLGIPIPHTAIIPENQGRIASTLSRFVQENFLDESALAPRLNSAKLGEKLALWLSNKESADTLSLQLKDLLKGVLKSLDDKQVSGFIAKAIPALSREVKLAPLLAEILSSIREGDKDGKLFNDSLILFEKLLDKHNEIIETLVSKELPWYIPGFIKHQLYVQVATALRRTITAVKNDQKHILREQLTHLCDKAFAELRANPEWEQRIQDLISNLCERGTVVDYLGNLKNVVIDRLQENNQNIFTESLAQVISYSAKAILADPAITEKLNQLVASILLRGVRDYGSNAGSFIEDTMKGWDSKLLSEKIEAEVGRDLQFIRINGTLVGGLVGGLNSCHDNYHRKILVDV